MSGNYNLSVVMNAKNNMTGPMSQALGDMGKFAPAAALAAAALAGIGAVLIDSTQKAANFQTQLTTLVTGAQESASNLASDGQAVLKMSTATATGTDQLVAGLYQINSASFHGADGLQVLKAAAQGAKLQNSNLSDVAKGVTIALNDYHLPASKAVAVTNDLVTTVGNGQTTMQDLSTSLSSILPTASAVGVGLADTTAAIATLTAGGTPAAQATTYLRQTMLALEAPSSGASKALKGVGLTTEEVSKEMKKSFPDALKMITDAVGQKFPVGSAKYIAALKNIVGGSKNLQGMLGLTGTHMKMFQDDTQSAAKALNAGGDSVQGFSDTQKTLNFQMDQAKQAINACQIELGQKLMPVLAKILTAVTPVIAGFADWINTLHANSPAIAIFGGIVAGLATIILVTVVPAMWTWAVATVAATWPLLLAAAIVAAVVIAIILAYQHWGQIMDWISGKAEQMRIKNEEAHVKMKLAADKHTAEQSMCTAWPGARAPKPKR